MNILIIEDEPATAQDLENTLLRAGNNVHILDKLDTIKASIEFIHKNQDIDLIFSDIQLADGLCFEIFKAITPPCPVIFCTAYDQYAIEAFQNNGIDYIVKPFSTDTIAKSLAKVEKLKDHFFQKNSALKDLSTLLLKNSNRYKSSFLVNFREKLLPVAIEDIAFFHLENELLYMHTFQSQKYTLNDTLDHLESQLDPDRFYRANRQFLINRKAVKEIEHYFSRKLFVKLNIPTPETIIVSKAKASAFLTWVESGN